MCTMNLKCTILLFSLNSLIVSVTSDKVSISPYLNAFKIYQSETQFGMTSYAYINPSIHSFNVTVKLADNEKNKQFIKSDLSVTIHTDRHQYYDLEKIESYTINTICKFNYGPDVIFLYRNICCRITIQDFNFTRNDFYSIKFCKYTLNHHSSACFIELAFLKSFIPKTNRDDHYHFGLRAFAFATNSDDCNLQSDVKKILAVSKLYPLSFSNGLSVFWASTFHSKLNLTLEIGRPFYSLDPDSSVSLPVKLITDKKFSYLKLICYISDTVEVKSVLFDERMFEAGYDISVLEKQSVVTMVLQNKGTNYQKSPQWWIGGGLLLFIIHGRTTEGTTYSTQNLQSDAWIKCKVVSFKILGETNTISLSSGEMEKITIAINSGKFIIIPIIEKKHYFSIFNDVVHPIQLENSFITLFSIHNVRDGSFIDVSNTATCDPINKFSVICPTSMLKSPDPYFQIKSIQYDNELTRTIPYKFDLVLQMQTWKAVIFSPVELWVAQDWRLDIRDRILNKIKNWRVPVRSAITKEVTCEIMFQRTSVRVLARLSNRNAISEKEYYGSTSYNNSPLLDITSQIQKESVEFSSSNTGLVYNEKSSELVVASQSAPNEIDVRLLALNNRRLLAIERVKITLDQVTISTVRAFCVSSLDLYQDKGDRLSNYRHLIVKYTYQNDTKELCYLFIIFVFSDNSEMRLDEIPNAFYRAFISKFDYAKHKYVEVPYEMTRLVQFTNFVNISVYESDLCIFPKLIFNGFVKVNFQQENDDATKPPTTLQSTTITSIVHFQITTNANQIQTKELLMNLSSLYYGLYALIALVSLVALIVLINCLVKFNYRKISHQSSNTTNQSVNNKLLSPAQPLSSVDASSPNFTKHPPLLPPPGPLRNASDSEVELASSTFWSNCSSQDSTSFTNRKYSSTILEQTIPLTPVNNFLMRSSPMVSSVYTNPKYRHNPSPSSDQGDGGYLSGDNPSKFAQMPLLKKTSDDRNINMETIDINSDNGGLVLYPETYPVPPPCPPLKWSIQWATSMVSALPVFSQSYTPNLMTDSTCVISRAVPCPGLTSSLNQWITNKTIPSTISVPYTKSIDNLCEISSGLGSLTSTQQEDYSMLSDDDNYHVSINSDKEHYRKYLKKC